jgi:hypothetical protein
MPNLSQASHIPAAKRLTRNITKDNRENLGEWFKY